MCTELRIPGNNLTVETPILSQGVGNNEIWKEIVLAEICHTEKRWSITKRGMASISDANYILIPLYCFPDGGGFLEQSNQDQHQQPLSKTTLSMILLPVFFRSLFGEMIYFL